MRKLVMGAVLAVMSVAVPAMSLPAQAAESAVAPKPAAVIDGFRSAKFGQTEAEVRKAIANDFGLKDAAIRHDIHPTERTTVLTVDVDNLLPGSGKAQVTYVLGYASQRLSHINVVWPGGEGKPDLALTAVALRNYFLGQEFKADSVVANAELADHTILVFRGADTKGRMVLLILQRPPEPGKGKKPDPAAAPPSYLRLTYVEKPTEPDVFQVKPGQF